MIYYDPHKWRTLLGLRGSVFPRAMAIASFSAVIAYVFKTMEIEGYISMSHIDNLSKGSVFSGFTFVIGFTTVFRTGHSYQRYWQAATSVHKMRSEWFDACSSLVAFAQASKAAQEEVQSFIQLMVRLFSLLHAMALEEIASLADENFPLLDVAGLCPADLEILMTPELQGKKMQMVLSWIKLGVMKRHASGLLDVPAPILTRVFQELGAGLTHYHNTLQVVIWPFPFPYTQMNFVMLAIYVIVTPCVLSLWGSTAWICAAFTFISVMCMVALDLISAELEHPFGDDANDLPCFEMQHAMNQDLVLLTSPCVARIPNLLHSAPQAYADLVSLSKEQQLSLQQYHEKRKSFGLRREGPALDRMKSWATQDFYTGSLNAMRYKRWVRSLTKNELEERVSSAPSTPRVSVATTENVAALGSAGRGQQLWPSQPQQNRSEFQPPSLGRSFGSIDGSQQRRPSIVGKSDQVLHVHFDEAERGASNGASGSVVAGGEGSPSQHRADQLLMNIHNSLQDVAQQLQLVSAHFQQQIGLQESHFSLLYKLVDQAVLASTEAPRSFVLPGGVTQGASPRSPAPPASPSPSAFQPSPSACRQSPSALPPPQAPPLASVSPSEAQDRISTTPHVWDSCMPPVSVSSLRQSAGDADLPQETA